MTYFEHAFSEMLQGLGQTNIEELFRNARLRDTISTNFPQLSSFETPGYAGLENFLGASDPEPETSFQKS